MMPVFSAAMSVRSTMAAAFTPMAMAIDSEISSRVAPDLRAFLMCPSRQPWHLAARLAPMAISSSVLDRKTKELVAIAASLATKCQGCLEGHIKKALKFGATKEEISESIAIAIGVNAAAIVDLTDIAAENMNLKLY